jgi:hypothetical protein
MAFTVNRTEGDREWGDLLADAAPHVPCPRDEHWSVAVDTRAPVPAFVATGPRCLSADARWAPRPAGPPASPPERWSHRRAIGARAQATVESVEEMLRDLVWYPVQVASNPLRRADLALARAFESAVLAELESERDEPLAVRFGSWSGEDDGLLYVCKVECAPRAGLDVPPAWRWWSPLVGDAAELAAHLRRALRARARPAATGAPAREFWGWGAVGQVGA